MLLEIVDLSVHYGTGEALKSISLKVDEGSVISIVGANGAGKTTILRSISGLKRPTSGEIWFQGKRIDGLEVRDIVKRGIAHVPEGKMIFSPLTVLENLKLGAFLRNDKNGINRDLDVMYEYFPVLKEKRRHSAGDLSGGQQQMLAVARAMMAAPKLLLMDEPTTGLSPILVAKVGEIITNIKFMEKTANICPIIRIITGRITIPPI